MSGTLFKWTANDTVPQIVTITDKATGLPVDLTTVTSVQLKMRPKNSTTTTATVTPTVYGTPTNGQISIPTTALLASRTPGNYEGEVQLTSPSGIETLEDLMQIQVRADFT